MTWIQLTSKQAQSLYGIPTEAANATENTFFGTPINLPYDYDVDRSLLAFLRNKELPDIATVYIKTIHPESWENNKEMLPNPLLTTLGGYLNLDKEALTNLIAIISAYQAQLSYTSSNRQTFKNIKGSNLTEYFQAYDPLTDTSADSIITILNLSRTVGFSTVFLKIMQFSLQELQDPKFQPLDRGQSRVNLDRSGFQELAILLQKQIELLG